MIYNQNHMYLSFCVITLKMNLALSLEKKTNCEFQKFQCVATNQGTGGYINTSMCIVSYNNST